MHDPIRLRLLGVALFLTHASLLAQPVVLKPKVRETTEVMSGSRSVQGVIGKIDKEGLVLIEVSEGGEATEHTIAAIDVLRKGDILPGVFGCNAYRWQDVKKGDSVTLIVMDDQDDKALYCTQICINRRPGARLPESQKPKADRRYLTARIYNDIENGEDVSDEDLQKAFKPQFIMDGKTGKPVPVPVSKDSPYFKYMEKLEAIRAKKKEGDLKATPPEKK